MNSFNNWSSLQQKFYERIPFKFDLSSFYREFPWFFFYKEILCKFFSRFQTWNRIFFWVSKKSCECSKINEIYLLWISSDPIFSKIRETFFFEKNPDFSKNFVDFFQKILKKSQIFQNSANFFILKFKCAKFQKFLFFQKNGLSSSGILKKNFRFSNLESDFFLILQKKWRMFQN